MNVYIATIIIELTFVALSVMKAGLFNLMDLALFSFPLFFFCIQGYKKTEKSRMLLR